MSRAPLRVLVVDDSAANRKAVTQALSGVPDVEVVGRAADGEEGLRQVLALRPDVVTLDLEMPRVDGFAFLRLLMTVAPTPVLVLSGWAQRADVFKALDLGAVDFLAKPPRGAPDAAEALRRDLLQKVREAALARPAGLRAPAPPARAAGQPFVVALGASTGGPPAVQRVLETAADEPGLCFVVAQHMPERFTHAFAERLDRTGPFTVREARSGDRLAPGHAFIAPGGRQLELVARPGGVLELEVLPPAPGDRHAPSVDRLFASAARVLGARALGVVLTGMGADGAEGARAIAGAGGEVWAEAEETSVVWGMPREAVATGAVRRVLPLPAVGPALVEAARRRR